MKFLKLILAGAMLAVGFKAQAQFERTYGARRAKALRTLLEDVTSRELTAG